MRLFLTKNGHPCIEVGNITLIFSSLGRNDGMYKYVVYSSKKITTVTTSGAKAKKKKTFSISENLNGCFDMNLRSTTAPNDIKKILPHITAEFLRKTIGKHLVNGCFPHSKIGELKREIESSDEYDETDFWDDDPTATESFD